ncbi:MAG: hypothetical protein K6C94_05065 [Candidatus Gastranaerophilales bacterium]|nr:hypothetical protein [Candidatus Gastranaerophilales bacterium]
MAANASVRTKKTIKRKNIEAVKAKKTASVYTAIKNTIKTVQVAIGSYAFLNILFWLAYTAKLADKSGLYAIFKPAWDFVNIFYTYKPLEGKDDIDFTGVVCSICIMVLVVILNSVHEWVSEMEETAKIEDAKRLERAKKRALAKEKGIIKDRKAVSTKALGFVFLMDIDIKQVSGFIQANIISQEEVVKIKTQFFKALLNNLNLNQISQKGYYRKKLFLNYKSINYFDDFIYYARETLNALSEEFSRPNIRIDFLVSLNLVSPNDDLKEKLDILDTVNKLGLKNEFICTQKLKDIYETNQKQTFRMVSKGVYNLSRNLNVSNNQEVYSLREV